MIGIDLESGVGVFLVLVQRDLLCRIYLENISKIAQSLKLQLSVWIEIAGVMMSNL